MNQTTSTSSAHELRQQTATPCLWARAVSRGRWHYAPHLQLLDLALEETITGAAGNRLAVAMPPRHGKSECCSKYLPAWFLGKFPDKRVILASYEANFAASWGRRARTLLEEHGSMFGVKVSSKSHAADSWEIDGREGRMMTSGVGGPIVGKGADLLIIDDPIKNSEQAMSETYREKAWDWYATTAYTRLEPGGVVVLIQTRWHLDDLMGRILSRSLDETGETWDVLNLPALAEANDPMGREPGEPLWPRRFDAGRLGQIRKTVGERWFSALYQQRPVPLEGGMFKAQYFNQTVAAAPYRARRVRAWDRAATKDGGCYTAGVLMAKDDEGNYYVENVVRGQWEPHERNQRMRAAALADRRRYGPSHEPVIWVEAEGGSSGRDAWKGVAKALEGFNCREYQVTGKKEVRAEPWSAMLAARNVYLVDDRTWDINAYVQEHCAFPFGAYLDQVDASSMAFNLLLGTTRQASPLRVISFGAAKKSPLRIALASAAELASLVVDDAALLVWLGDPGSETPPHGLNKLADALALSFVDLDPAERQDRWADPVLPWGKPPAELIMQPGDGKRLWAFLRKQRQTNPGIIVIADPGDRRAESAGLAVCDVLGLPRGVALCRPAEEEWKATADTRPPNPHVYACTKHGRGMVV